MWHLEVSVQTQPAPQLLAREEAERHGGRVQRKKAAVTSRWEAD